eukprot:jgi/Psemu1/14285/gm1.14285_g
MTNRRFMREEDLFVPIDGNKKTEDPSAKTIHQHKKVGIDDLRDSDGKLKDNNSDLDLRDDDNDSRDNNANLRDNDPTLGCCWITKSARNGKTIQELMIDRLQKESGACDTDEVEQQL